MNRSIRRSLALVLVAALAASSLASLAQAATEVPSKPRAATAASGSGAGEITVRWLTPDFPNDLTGFNVYAGSSSTSLSLVATVGDVRSYVHSGLANGEQVFFQVTALNEIGESEGSNVVKATAPVPPSAPQRLKANVGPNPGDITLTWGDPLDAGGSAITSYRVYRGSASGSLSYLATVGNVLTFTDPNRPLGTDWYYKVSAVNAAGEGPRSVEATAKGTLPPAPPNPTDPVVVPAATHTVGDSTAGATVATSGYTAETGDGRIPPRYSAQGGSSVTVRYLGSSQTATSTTDVRG